MRCAFKSVFGKKSDYGIIVDIIPKIPVFFALYQTELSTLSTGLSTGKTVKSPAKTRLAGDNRGNIPDLGEMSKKAIWFP